MWIDRIQEILTDASFAACYYFDTLKRKENKLWKVCITA